MAQKHTINLAVNANVSTRGINDAENQTRRFKDRLGEVLHLTDSINASSRTLGRLASANANEMRAMSKMAMAAQGTLAPSYAILAANAYAATSAINTLQKSIDTEIMKKASDVLTETFKVDTRGTARQVQRLTDNMITLGDAFKHTNMVVAAGLGPDVAKQLAKYGALAAKAQGRNTSDSIRRMIQGTIKAEPELLDELGIILRLIPASEKYAASIGKSANALTTFEKQQAIANEVISQAKSKFASIAKMPESNEISKVITKLSDVTETLLGHLGSAVGYILKPVASSDWTALAATFLLMKGALKFISPQIQELTKGIKAFDAQRVSNNLRTNLDKAAARYEVSPEFKVQSSNLKASIKDAFDIMDKAFQAAPTYQGKGIWSQLIRDRFGDPTSEAKKSIADNTKQLFKVLEPLISNLRKDIDDNVFKGSGMADRFKKATGKDASTLEEAKRHVDDLDAKYKAVFNSSMSLNTSVANYAKGNKIGKELPEFLRALVEDPTAQLSKTKSLLSSKSAKDNLNTAIDIYSRLGQGLTEELVKALGSSTRVSAREAVETNICRRV